MRTIFIIIFIVLFTSCAKKRYQLTEDEKLANKITHHVAMQLKRDLDLYPVGTGGRIPDKIEMLGLSFHYYQPVDINLGRKLLISAIHRFVDEINTNGPIRKYLTQYPFQPENIEIRIFLYNPDHLDVTPGELSVIVYSDGFLKYKIDDPENEYRLKTIHKETYEEAVKQLFLRGKSGTDPQI